MTWCDGRFCTCNPGPMWPDVAAARRRVRIKRAWRRIRSIMRRTQAHRTSRGGVK